MGLDTKKVNIVILNQVMNTFHAVVIAAVRNKLELITEIIYHT